MSILAWIEDQRKLKILNAPKYKHPTSDGSQGLWTRCDNCGVILYIKHLKENQRVCFGCHYHLQMNSNERIQHLIDAGTWRPLDETVSPCDPLEFRDQKSYLDRLKEAQERTGLQDALQTGTGLLDGIPVALGIMDFQFMGGSMGSVVGEKLTRLIEYATQEGLTLIILSASGGARMQEGIFSLMQMSRISAALHVHQSCANLLYISVLTSPTTGGVTASFAMLGDLIFAEPKAVIGFAGRRVIEQTLQEQLPDDFQTSEYLLHHGLLDLIVPRCFLKQALSETMTIYKDAPYKQKGTIPFGVQAPLSFVREEHVRRQFKKFDQTARIFETFQKQMPWPTNDISTHVAHAVDVCGKDSSADFLYREVLTSFETMFALVAPQQDADLTQRHEKSQSGLTQPSTPVQSPDSFVEQALAFARSESIQWRAVYASSSATSMVPFLPVVMANDSGTAVVNKDTQKEQSFIYKIVPLTDVEAVPMHT
jgi:acetyl-CoA carboxylase carboxyl transferase subunit beta